MPPPEFDGKVNVHHLELAENGLDDNLRKANEVALVDRVRVHEMVVKLESVFIDKELRRLR